MKPHQILPYFHVIRIKLLILIYHVLYVICNFSKLLIVMQAEEGEEDDEIRALFKLGKKRKKNEKSAAEIAELVETLMAELEVVAEEDAVLNTQGKPAINKLRKLPLLTEALSK